MLPISAIVGVSTAGYLLDQAFRENEFNQNNEESSIPISNINGCAEQYPWNFVESFDDISINNSEKNFKVQLSDLLFFKLVGGQIQIIFDRWVSALKASLNGLSG